MNFRDFFLEEQYQKVQGLGDRLALMKEQISWQPFIPLVRQVYHDNREMGGRPHTDELVIVRSLLLQSWYGLSDPDLEFACNDRLSFRNFLGLAHSIPDFSTIWKARERLKEAGVEEQIWTELQRQLEHKGYTVQGGVIQDATFVEADVGRKRHRKEKQAKKRGEEIVYTKKQQQHRDQDGSFSIKHGQVHYGYKTHIKLDRGWQLIRAYQTTTASLFDGEVDLGKEGEVIYRDRAWTGKETKATGNASMKRGNLSPREKLRNRRISKKRAPGERPFAVIKRVFRGARTQVKTLARVNVKEMFTCFAYNLYQLVTLQRKKGAQALSS